MIAYLAGFQEGGSLDNKEPSSTFKKSTMYVGRCVYLVSLVAESVLPTFADGVAALGLALASMCASGHACFCLCFCV